MEYRANDRDVFPTVRDFEAMCEYIRTNTPPLTQKGDLSTKACFALNNLMTHPRPGAKKTDRMGKYPTINLYFQAASASGLLKPYGTKGGKTAIALSEVWEALEKMNGSTKYLYLFLGWMHYTDIEELYARDPYIVPFGSSFLDAVIAEIGNQSKFEWILREEEYDFFVHFEKPLQLLMHSHFDLLCHLRDFGWLVFDDADVDASDNYHITVGKLRVTPLGATLAAACGSRRFSWVNRLEQANLSLGDEDESDSVVIELFEADFEKTPPGSDGFLTPFLHCFSEGAIDSVTLNGLLFPHPVEQSANTVYEFKVQLERTCYRVIRCGARHTFEYLHLAIQEAFAFDNDHLYSFFMDGKRWSRRRIDSPYSEEPPYADEVLIGQSGLYENQTILYLFDYGDEWEFLVTVTSILNMDFPPERPVVVQSKGKAPEQYPDWEGDFEDDDDGFDAD